MKILVATGNLGKLKEFRRLLDIRGLELICLKDLNGDYPDCIEDGGTFRENAEKKVRHWAGLTGMNVLADDSGLAVDALGGAPGVHSARFAGEDATDNSNNTLLVEKLKGVKKRSARFICNLSLGLSGRDIVNFQGTVDGEILESQRGDNGFGYDPLFYHPESGKTFAEISPEMKNSISHRAKAAIQLRDFLSGNHLT